MKHKKIIAILLVIALLTTTFLIVSIANENETKVEVTVSKTELSAGERATVSVKVEANYPVATMSIPVFFDKTKVEVSNATANLTNYKIASITTNNQSTDTAKVFANTGLSESQFGFVLVNYIGEAGQQLDSSMSSVVLTFEIIAKDGVSGDAAVKVVSSSAKTEDNVEGMLYFGKTGTTLNEIPENVTDIDVTKATTNISIVGGKNSIVLDNDANVEAVFDTNYANNDYAGFIYGIDTLANVTEDGLLADNITTKQGDDYLEIIGDETTGTIINLLDKNGNVLETYVFIYFGDIDGSGDVTSTDGFIAEYFEATGEGIDTVYTLMAGDVDGSGDITSTDGFTMEYFEAIGEGLPSQQEIAAMVSGNYYEL